MGIYIGIDLGTTYSVVARVDSSGSPVVIQASPGSVTTPSAVYVSENGELLIGEEAKENQKYKEQVATFYKRNIGQEDACCYLEDGNGYSSVELSSMFLRELIKNTEKSTGQKVDGAVITVPAYFTEHEKTNTRIAAEKAGINVMHMVNEPTAAAIAYGLDKADRKKVLIYDLGGGTFDISVADITRDKIRITATAGDHQLGGKEWDDDICRWMAQQFEAQFGEDFTYDSEQMDSIRIDAEKLKRKLTAMDKAEVKVKYEGNTGIYTLSESEFRSRTRSVLERTGDLINTLFADNNMSWADIDDVILIGGSTRMKMVEDYISELRGGKHALRGINPDEAVALGAALLADSFSHFALGEDAGFEIMVGDKKVEDVNSHSLGLIAAREEKRGSETFRVFYNEIMIPKNTSLEDAHMTKNFILNSDTQDIYLTQWESDELPENQAIIGKYQVKGITPNQAFSVTYYHTPDSTVDIRAEQSGRSLSVEKVLSHADRTFEPELIKKKAARGAIVVAVDLSGSMCNISDHDALNDFISRVKSGRISGDEKNLVKTVNDYIEVVSHAVDGNLSDSDYRIFEDLACKIPYTSIGMVKKFIIQNLVENIDLKNVSVGITGFADAVKVCCNLTDSETVIRDAVNSLAVTPQTGECNNAHPMDQIYDILSRQKVKQLLDFAYAVILTDGCWAQKAASDALAAKSRFVSSGIEIIAIGFGEANDSFISQLATMSDLSGVGDMSSLEESLSNIAQVINDI